MRKEKEATKSVGQIALSFDKTTSWRAKGGGGEGEGKGEKCEAKLVIKKTNHNGKCLKD